MALAVPMTTYETLFVQAETAHFAQSHDVGFAARALPLAVTNVAITGGVTSMQGSAFALHGQETVAALFGFDRSFIAPNNGRFSGIQARNADEAMAALTALANEDYVTFGKHTSGLVLEVAIKIFAAPAAAAKLGLDGSVGLAKIGKAAGKHTGEFARDERGSVPTGRATNNAGEVITGARTLSRMDAEGWDLAEDFYEQMRRSGGSVDEIAENTGLSRGAVERAYRHLFLDSHQLDDGLRRFDADPEIVNAWNRMRHGTHTTADIDLVNHERFEAILMQRYGQPYRCAHATANACGFQSPIDN